MDSRFAFCFRLLTILFLITLSLAVISPAHASSDIVFQLNNQGLTLLSSNRFNLGPVTAFLSPWLYTVYTEQQQTSYGLKEGGIELRLGNLQLTAGRQINTFGPGRYNFPLLSPLGEGLTAQGLDNVAYSFSTERLDYKKLYAWVPSDNEFRLLLGQRATYDLGPFTLGFAETALAKEGLPSFYYLPLPLVPVGAYQLIADHYQLPEARGGLNILAEIDLTLHLGPNFKVYGGYLIDERPSPYLPGGLSPGEWQNSEPDSKPWKIGYQAGGEWNRPFGISGVKFFTEYTRINQFTYTATDPFFTYSYKEKPLGGPLGPDSDQLNLEFATNRENTWEFGLAYSRQRRGEGRLGDQWTYEPGQTEVFLTGTVETTDKIALTGIKRLGFIGSDQVALTISYARITNENNQPGVISIRPEVAVVGRVGW